MNQGTTAAEVGQFATRSDTNGSIAGYPYIVHNPRPSASARQRRVQGERWQLRNRFISSLVLLAIACSPAFSATYYVDSEVGNDSFSGTQYHVAGQHGPWRTLGRVSSASFLPGDAVLLKCGQTWRETLTIRASGTPSRTIRIGSYPGGCTDYPILDGSLPVPAHNWSAYSGQMYRAKFPISLLSNGSFEDGIGAWRKWSPAGTSSIASSTDCMPAGSRCLSYRASSALPKSLLTSPPFAIDPIQYTLSLSVKVPVGTSIRILTRRDDTPWDVLGLDTTLSGTGSWKTYAFSFQGLGSARSARIDIEVPPDKTIWINNVNLTANVNSPHKLFVDEEPLEAARYPNPGHDSTRPNSPYLKTAGDSDRISVDGATVSTYVVTGSDLRLPTGVVIEPGVKINVRTRAWWIDERKVARVSGNRIHLDAPTTYDLKAGWGYYLSGALWMLNSPGEWHHSSGNYLYVWTPESQPPASRVAIAFGTVGIDASDRANIVIERVAIRRFATAVRFRKGTNISIRNIRVSDTTNEGIDASGSLNSTIQDTVAVRTGRDAISGLDRSTWRMADGLRVIGNYVSEAGVRLAGGKVVSSPIQSNGAVHPGTRAQVYGNRVINSGYHGVWARADSTVDLNYVKNACLVLDDCGGVYLGSSNNTTVTRNLIVGIAGAIDGKPETQQYSQGQGIFLDDHMAGGRVANNTVIDADNGIQIHNAFNNRIEGNQFYGNRNYQILLQEDSRSLRPEGNIYGNTVSGNLTVPTLPTPSLMQSTIFSSTSDFAQYSGNVYSGLLSPQVAREIWSGSEKTYRFPEWQAARDQSGFPRDLDSDGRQVVLSGFATYRMSAVNLVPNGDLAAGIAGWSSWNATAPYGTLTLVSCTFGPCLRYSPGASKGLVSSGYFSVVKDQWYRVTFDLKTTLPTQTIRWMVRRGGGGTNLYESLMGPDQKVYGSTSWKRYSHIFKTTKTVNMNDPVTLDRGARLDFENDNSGQAVWIANAEVVPITTVGAALRTSIVFNPEIRPQLIDCPDTGALAVFCSNYVRLTDGSPITWPHSLEPLGAEIIYSRGDTLVDTDGDSIADIQDVCPATSAGLDVNSRGCAIVQ